MFCPNCSTESTEDWKYCRNCGMDLTAISGVLTGRLQVIDPAAPGAHFTPGRSQRGTAARWGFITFWGGIVLAALFGIIGNAIENADKALGGAIEDLAGLGALVVLVGIGMMLFSLFLPRARTFQATPARVPTSGGRTQPQLPAEPFRQPVSSVTESTTRLFDEQNPAATPRRPERTRE